MYSIDFIGDFIIYCEINNGFLYYINENNVLYKNSISYSGISVIASFIIDAQYDLRSFSISGNNTLMITTISEFINVGLITTNDSDLAQFQYFYIKHIELPYNNYTIEGVFDLNQYIIFIGMYDQGDFLLIASNSDNYPLLYLLPIQSFNVE